MRSPHTPHSQSPQQPSSPTATAAAAAEVASLVSLPSPRPLPYSSVFGAAAGGPPSPTSAAEDAPHRPPSRLASAAAALVDRYVSGEVVDGGLLGTASSSSFRRARGSGLTLAPPPSPPPLGPSPSSPHAIAAAIAIQTAYRRHARRRAAARPFSKLGAAASALVERYVSGGAVAAAPTAEAFHGEARLVLHFDVNKTIVMTDSAQGAGVDCLVNMLLSECAWGRLEPGPRWAPVGRLAGDRPEADPQLMTYRSFLDSFALPDDAPSGAAAGAAAVAATPAARKAARLDLKRRFTEPGHPGAMFRSVFDVLTARLGALEDACCRGAAGAGRSHCSHGHSVLRPRVLPSFFNLLLHLQAQRREFTLILRSFGTDLPAVVDEINAFAEGRHPNYPDARLDGSDGRVDVRIRYPDSVGAFARTSAAPDGTCLLMGAPRELLAAHRYTAADVIAAATAPGARLLTTFPAIHAALTDPPPDGVSRAFALRDFYPFWRATGESGRGGKVFPMRAGLDAVSVFFDDNIGHAAANIVDARTPAGDPVAFADARRQLVRAEPVGAILDDAFFVRAVHEAVAAAARGARRRRADTGARLWRVTRARLLTVVRLQLAAKRGGGGASESRSAGAQVVPVSA